MMEVTSIVAYNQSLAATPWNMFSLPPLVPGTAGLALPKADTTAVMCIAPGEATTYNKNWGQQLTLHPGNPHLALAKDDTYPNQVFSQDYVVVEAMEEAHPLAQVLLSFWHDRNCGRSHLQQAWRNYLSTFGKKRPKWVDRVKAQVEAGHLFFLARKEQQAIIRGVIDLRFQTSEGPTLAEHGSVLVEHPDDPTNQWLIRPDKFTKRYDWVREPSSGLLIPDVQ